MYRRQVVFAMLMAGAGVNGRTTMLPPSSRTILVLGDSLSAEYGLRRGSGWVALLQKKLAEEHLPARVINASISGETTAGGRSRLSALLALHQPTHVLIELGGNDALRGLPLEQSQENLINMIHATQKTGAKVLLIGMQVPPNYGKDYAKRFTAMFASASQANRVALVPSLLKGLADSPETLADSARWFQTDRIHPREEAHPIMLTNVWSELKKQLQ